MLLFRRKSWFGFDFVLQKDFNYPGTCASQGTKTPHMVKRGQRGPSLSSSAMCSVPRPRPPSAPKHPACQPPTRSRKVNVAEPPPRCPPSSRSPGALIPHQPSCRGHHTQIVIDTSPLNPDWLHAVVTSQWESSCEWIPVGQIGKERKKERGRETDCERILVCQHSQEANALPSGLSGFSIVCTGLRRKDKL